MNTAEIRCEFSDLIKTQCACWECAPGVVAMFLDGEYTVIAGEGAELDEPVDVEQPEERVS